MRQCLSAALALVFLTCVHTAAGAEGNELTVGVGLDQFLSVEGGLAEEVKIEVSDEKVARASFVTPQRLGVHGLRPGTATISFRTQDNKSHRYQVEVVEPTKEMFKAAGIELMEIGLGQVRNLDTPIVLPQKGDLVPTMVTSDPHKLNFEVVNSQHTVVMGMRAGYANFTFISSDDALTRFHFRLTKARHNDPPEKDAQKLSLVVGQPIVLKQSPPFDGQSLILVPRPDLVEIVGSAAPMNTNQRIKRAPTLTLSPKQVGTTDLLVCLPDEDRFVHYQIVVEDPKAVGKE